MNVWKQPASKMIPFKMLLFFLQYWNVIIGERMHFIAKLQRNSSVDRIQVVSPGCISIMSKYTIEKLAWTQECLPVYQNWFPNSQNMGIIWRQYYNSEVNNTWIIAIWSNLVAIWPPSSICNSSDYLARFILGQFFDSLTPKHGSRHQTVNSEANNNRNMTILSNLAAILAGILATILGLQPTWLFRRFNLVITLDFLTHKTLV